MQYKAIVTAQTKPLRSKIYVYDFRI